MLSFWYIEECSLSLEEEVCQRNSKSLEVCNTSETHVGDLCNSSNPSQGDKTDGKTAVSFGNNVFNFEESRFYRVSRV